MSDEDVERRVVRPAGQPARGRAWAADAATLVPGANLVGNGGAEAPPNPSGGPVAITSWTGTAGGRTVVPYAVGGGFPSPSDPGPADRGSQFYSGGQGFPLSAITQAVSVADDAALIDAGTVGFTLSAFLGGFSAQNDAATFDVTFQGGAGGVLGVAALVGPTAAERGNLAGLLLRSATGLIPAGTRSLLFGLTAVRTEGVFNDGYADSLSFVATPPAPIPVPAALPLLGIGLAGLLAVGRCPKGA